MSPRKEIPATPKNSRCHFVEGTALSVNRQTNTDITTDISTTDYTIQSYQDTLQAFQEKIGYDAICIDRPFDVDRLDEIVGIAVDVLTTTKDTVRINQEEKPTAIVKSVFWKLDMFRIQFILNSLTETKTKIRNMRAVLLTALYNSAFTLSNSVMNQVVMNGDISSKCPALSKLPSGKTAR